jgi:tRNA G18 (ribose-2'-O)-methylase SpoU
MSQIIKIEDFSAPELDVFVRLTGAELRRGIEEGQGILIAESSIVVDVALRSGIEPIALLTDERLLESESVKEILDRCGSVPVYAASTEVLRSLTGFALTRGVLCAMRRPVLSSVESVVENARRIAIFDGITDAANIGALFRSAAALGVDAVLVTSTCCDPLCRRAVRVSMGTVFQVPFTVIGKSEEQWQTDGMALLRSLGFKLCAMALSDDSISISSPVLREEERIALVLGTEGAGLAPRTVSGCDYTVKIPMSHGVDSLNVSCAGTLAFWELCR